WHWSAATQMTGFVPTQAPAWQASVCVHASWSSQPVPSALFGFEQVPLAGSHVPASWHWSSAAHTTGFVPVHTPPRQKSCCVHAFPSLHAVSSGLFGFEQTPLVGSHVPT